MTYAAAAAHAYANGDAAPAEVIATAFNCARNQWDSLQRGRLRRCRALRRRASGNRGCQIAEKRIAARARDIAKLIAKSGTTPNPRTPTQ